MTVTPGCRIRAGRIAGKGRGVLAAQPIVAGAAIERCPVLIIPEADRLATDQTVVFTYIIMWEEDRSQQDLYEGHGRAAIALGLTSLLNHSAMPNATIVRDLGASEVELRALRNIEPGEEITIDYQMDLWFDPV